MSIHQMKEQLQEQNTITVLQRNTFTPSYKEGFTNNVFKYDKHKKVIYYLPAYLRLKVKNIVNLDLFTLTGEVNCTFILSVFYANMEPQAVQFLSNSIQLAFHKSDAIVLNTQSLQIDRKKNQKKSLLTFTIRKVIAARLQGQIFWSPFQTVKFVISVALRTLKKKIQNKSYTFKFNLMDCQDIQTKFSLAEQWGFGMFKIAQNQLYAQYTNQFAYSNSAAAAVARKKNIKLLPVPQSSTSLKHLSSKKQIASQQEQHQPLSKKLSIHNFQYAHFILPVYKKPNSTLMTIYFPLILLGIINIAIFYQDNSRTGKKMLNIASLLVSFIALLPTVRQNTAVSPTVTFTQILVFLQSFTTLLTFGHMLDFRKDKQRIQSLSEDGYEIACIVITALVLSSVIVMSLLHKFYWKKKYHKSGQQKKGFKFQPRKWSNKACDDYYIQQVDDIQSSLVLWQDPDQQFNLRHKFSIQQPIQININKKSQVFPDEGQSSQNIKIKKFQSL